MASLEGCSAEMQQQPGRRPFEARRRGEHLRVTVME